ncbi:jg27294 [Pararge aegeria aegeria]|uniref:Jg27294 protein n=1 Tax=Pararge aegeria aegeria TaxID=348720 RepID=A0A8S4SPJ8_9NEOP|nr:jg27294 [Pararge aegeria aegeria]
MVPKLSFNIKFFIAAICMLDRETCVARLRILGGRDALKNEFPFAVRLELQFVTKVWGITQVKYHPFCTGAALTPSWILTAAHCDDENVLKLLFHKLITAKPRKFARYNSYFPNEFGQLSPITKVLVYPGYCILHSGTIRTGKYDLAMYKTENLIVSQYGKISAIDYGALLGHEAILLGFGRTNATPWEKPLQVLKTIFIKCGEREGHQFGMLCVVPTCGLEATGCGGDSGGPVVHASGIVGTIHGGGGYCNEFSHKIIPGRAAGIISMVSPVVDWISNIVNNKTNER